MSLDDESETPTLPSLLGGVIERALSGLWTALPGRVTEWDAGRGLATVQSVLLRRVPQVDGTIKKRPYAPFVNVPVIATGGRSNRITNPVEVGDGVLLVFCSRSIDTWVAVGGDVDPGDDRRHDLSDAIAIPGLFDAAHVPPGGNPTDAAVWHADDIRLGGVLAADYTMRGTTYRTGETTFHAAITTFLGLLSTYIAAIKPIADPTNAATPTITTGIGTLTSAIATFEAAAVSYLSRNVKVI